MAKNDDKRSRNQIDYQKGIAQNTIDRTEQNLVPQNQAMQNNYTNAAATSMTDYNDIMGRYRANAATPFQWNPVSAERVNYSRDPSVQKALTGFGEFADTGGYSQGDQNELRARGISPIRAVYGNMKNEMDRGRALQGGYSPNFNAASAKMARESSGMIADKTSDVNAWLAEQIRSGRLAGMQGLGDVGIADSQMKQQAALANASNALQASGLNLQGEQIGKQMSLDNIHGMRALYGTNPALSSAFGDQVLQSNAQSLQIPQLQNQLGLGVMGNQNEAGRLPGQWESNVGRIRDVMDIGGNIAGAF